jgi:ubiquitin-protein ligase
MENSETSIIAAVNNTENYAKINFAKKRLDREFQMLLKENKLITNEYHIEKIDEMFLKVKIFNITNELLLTQIKKLQQEYIEIGIRITKDYPYTQPYVWIIKPFLKCNIDNTNNNVFTIKYEINHQIQWAPAFGIYKIINQVVKLLDNVNVNIDENNFQNDEELELLNCVVDNIFTMLDKGYQLKEMPIETLFQIQNYDNDNSNGNSNGNDNSNGNSR